METTSRLLNGVTVIRTKAISSKQPSDKASNINHNTLTAIPYFAWANRGQGEMSVWINSTK